ncbi:UCP2 protein, partial [Chroicocephalus maculipennis]|nr:UCP2 protein [Chroicocephalus maculipennis]
QGEAKLAGQAQYKGVFGTITTVGRTEGLRSLYRGLVAGLQRQMTFTSLRLGLYDWEKQPHTKGSQRAGLGSWLVAGCTTGAMVVASPQTTDVVKVRFQTVREGGRCYQGSVDGHRTIAKQEGVHGLCRGGCSPQGACRDGSGTVALNALVHAGPSPNSTRSAIVNCAELRSHPGETYDPTQDTLLQSHLRQESVPCHFASAFRDTFWATLIVSPMDVVKTRYMNAAPGQYRSVGSCALTLLRNEELEASYKGFVPSFLQLGSWNTVTFVTYEQLKRGLMA